MPCERKQPYGWLIFCTPLLLPFIVGLFGYADQAIEMKVENGYIRYGLRSPDQLTLMEYKGICFYFLSFDIWSLSTIATAGLATNKPNMLPVVSGATLVLVLDIF